MHWNDEPFRFSLQVCDSVKSRITSYRYPQTYRCVSWVQKWYSRLSSVALPGLRQYANRKEDDFFFLHEGWRSLLEKQGLYVLMVTRFQQFFATIQPCWLCGLNSWATREVRPVFWFLADVSNASLPDPTSRLPTLSNQPVLKGEETLGVTSSLSFRTNEELETSWETATFSL